MSCQLSGRKMGQQHSDGSLEGGNKKLRGERRGGRPSLNPLTWQRVEP